MLVYKNYEGSIIISDMIDGQYIDRVYQGYTKREAMVRFRREVREVKTKQPRFFNIG